ncbi:hypothetical protein [Mucilaginibacter gotjawali]|uniref:Uncharacterized protein n=2 Tax=Mucilaginibacter gotjawali TaxID=1550579 RepID=A0A839SE44_9SPHI|nr:hypothetical protein [Mucilaginibacter gotjawali]MBB3055160.1 hypothetical protein [Mucilaginibacter gotjawali]BAU56221.1 hypothetical protein MgSA37_04418 [Mucilaginibacter gotjawali]
MTGTSLVLSDTLLVVTVAVINLTNESIDQIPVFLKFLIIIAVASCIIRHINHYRHTKRLY